MPAALVALAVAAGCQAGHPSSRPPTRPGVTAAPTARTSESIPATRTSAPTPLPSADPAAGNPGRLTDEQMVGQLFVAYLYGAGANTATPAQRSANLALYGAATAARIVEKWHLGGVILLDHNSLDPLRSQLSTGNVDTASQITRLTAGLQQVAEDDTGAPLLIGTDQEGGSVQRIRDGVTARPPQQSLSHSGPTALRCGYYRLGQQLRRLGVNQDYAPDADVIRADGGVIGDRSFGPDPLLDARDVSAAVAGLQDAGVLATLKHWPGHGSTATDSHAALAVITRGASQWQAIDRPPFAAAAATAAGIMVGHLALPALDPTGTPATLSPILVGQQLRKGLGFQGLVLTDSLWMQPMRAAGSPGDVAERAIRAGDDLLLMSPDLPAAYRHLLALVRTDPAFRDLVRAAARRILAAKAAVLAGPRSAPAC